MPKRAKGVGKPQRQRRLEHPLTIRVWVRDLEPEEIHRELLGRIAALDETIAPARDHILKIERVVTERALRRLGLEAIVPKAVALLDDPAGAPRLHAMMMVARYYAEHPHEGVMYLPPITVAGNPPVTPPDMIHVLDLSPDDIRRAITALRPDPKRLEAELRELAQTSTRDHEFLAVLGIQAIRVQSLGAIFNPVFQVALFVNLARAHYAAAADEARAAADLATRLFDEFLPDLSRHTSRRPDQLMELETRRQEHKQKALGFLQGLYAEGLVPKKKALARTLFDNRVTSKDLVRWLRDTPDADMVADELIRRERGIGRKTLRDYRRLWGQAEAVAEAWQKFDEYFARLSLEEQRRLVPLTQPSDSPPSSPPETPPTA